MKKHGIPFSGIVIVHFYLFIFRGLNDAPRDKLSCAPYVMLKFELLRVLDKFMIHHSNLIVEIRTRTLVVRLEACTCIKAYLYVFFITVCLITW